MNHHKNTNMNRTIGVAAALVVLAGNTALAGGHHAGPKVVPINSKYHGKSYEEWGGSWWKWFMEQPVVSTSGVTHPGIDAPTFDVNEGQHGSVWFLAATFGADRTCTIPAGKSLFIATLNAECSNLEDPPFFGGTSVQRHNCASDFADLIDPLSLFFTINGDPVDLADFRAASPDIKFNAPTPWIYGATGGRGRSSGDGYYILLEPLPPGHYDISFGGVFGGPPALTQTYHLTVSAHGDGDND